MNAKLWALTVIEITDLKFYINEWNNYTIGE